MRPRHIVEGLAWVLLFLACLVVSVIGHLDSRMGCRVGRVVANALVSDLIVGRLEIGRIDRLSLDGIVARHVSLYGRDGKRVIQGNRIYLVIDPWAATRGVLRFSHAHLNRGTLRLETLPDGDLSFLDALEAADDTPSNPNDPPFHAIVDDMRVERITAYGDFLGLRGIVAQDVHVQMRMEFERDVDIRIYSGAGRVVAPFPYVGHLDAVTAVIRGDPHAGIEVHARAHAGEDRIRVGVRYAVPEGQPDDAPSELDLIAHADPVRMSRLVESGFDWAGIFLGRGRGYVRLYGPVDQLRLSASLSHDAGDVHIEGKLPSEGEVVIFANTERLQTDRLFEGFPALVVGGHVELDVGDEQAGGETTLRLDLLDFSYDGYAIPALRVEAALEEDRVRIDDINAVYGTGELHGAGDFYYDGRWDLAVKGNIGEISRDPNVQRHAPRARGRVSLALRASYADGATNIRSSGTIRGLAYAGVTADQARYTLRMSPERGPSGLELEVDAENAAIEGYAIGTGTVVVRGERDAYAARLDFAGREGSRTEARATVRSRGNAMFVDVPSLLVSREGHTWAFSAEDIRIDGARRVNVGAITGRSGTQTLNGSLDWSAAGNDRFVVSAHSIDLEGVRALVGPMMPELSGNLNLDIDAGGDFDIDPNFSITAQYADLGSDIGPRVSGALEIVYRDDVLVVNGDGSLVAPDARGAMMPAGNVHLRTRGEFAATIPSFMRSARDGSFDVSFEFDELDLATVVGPFSPSLGISGMASGSLVANGPLFFSPTFAGFVRFDDLSIGEITGMDVRFETDYEYGSLGVHAWAVDDSGPVIEGDGALQIDVLQAIGNFDVALASLETLPWRFSLRLPPRTLGSLPSDLRARLGVTPALAGLEVAATMSLRGGAFQTRGVLMASVEETIVTQRSCGNGTRPRMDLVARLEDGTSHLDMFGLIGDRRVLTIEAHAETPINEWLRKLAIQRMPAVSLAARANFDSLERVPVLCEYTSGRLNADLDVAGLFTDAPTVTGSIDSDALQVRRVEIGVRNRETRVVEQTDPVELEMRVNGDASSLHTHGVVRWSSGGSTNAAMDLAWLWGTDGVPAVEDDAQMVVRLDADDTPLEAVLAFVPGFGRVDGRLDGRVLIGGTLESPTIDGALTIADGRIDLTSLGQRLRGVSGRIELTTGLVELRDLTARDGDGTVHIDGSIPLDGLVPASLALRVRADAFPVRVESSVMGRLSGEAVVAAELGDGQLTGDVTFERLDVVLPEESSRSPQDLDAHPDVTIVSRETGPVADEDPYIVDLQIDATRRFWVRSQTFSAMVAANLGVHYADPDFRVSGSVEIFRGFFEVFGKRFDVTRGSLAFDGGTSIDPVVSLEAIHQLRGGSDRTVTVRASGTLSRPIIEFVSPLVATGDQGEIIRLLVTGSTSATDASASSGSEDDAREQAADFLAGVAFGVLTLSLREQFGEFMPVIAVETVGFGTARVRAGFNLGQLLPDRIRNVVQGIYIEGFFTAGSNDNAQASQGGNAGNTAAGGFTIELQFPRSIVQRTVVAPTSSSFGVDVTWEP